MSDLRPIDCTACPIRHRAVCARCDAAELDQLAAIKTYRNFSAGAQIMVMEIYNFRVSTRSYYRGSSVGLTTR